MVSEQSDRPDPVISSKKIINFWAGKVTLLGSVGAKNTAARQTSKFLRMSASHHKILHKYEFHLRAY